MRCVQGVDNLTSVDAILRDRRLGLITGPTGVDAKLNSTVDILSARYNLVRLFAPEHGVRGDRQAGASVESYFDEETGLEVVSLYGANANRAALVDGIDVVVIDMQDVGARFYTYLYTMTQAMETCAAAGVPVVVLDHVNPLGLECVEGTLLDETFSSFVGKYAVPTRYGLTMGEFARHVNRIKGFGCELYVAPCVGLTRDMWFEDTGLIWVTPSPNIPTPDSALCYIGMCLFEGTNLSEGRGTTRPFEQVGAPWLKVKEVLAEMQAHDLPGVAFRPCYFTPAFSKHEGELCKGVALHITDKRAFRSFETGLRLLQAIRKHCPEFEFRSPAPGRKSHFDLIAGCDEIEQEGFDADAFLQKHAKLVAAFREDSRQDWLY